MRDGRKERSKYDSPHMFVSAIIAAGGRGDRFGAVGLKQLVPVGGRPILERSVSAFLAHPSVNEVIVALPPELVDDPPPYLRNASKPLRIVSGGARRQDSVANAFRVASNECQIVIVHDAARPFASAQLIDRTIAAAAESGAALAAIRARDTVKLVVRHSQDMREPTRDRQGREQEQTDELFVQATLPRETVFLAQTPQAFRRDVFIDALAYGDDATDEAGLAERAGHRVSVVDGEASNIKITTIADLPIAETIAAEREASSSRPLPAKLPRTGRAGTGYDLHRLVAGRPLVVGGVTIPSDRGALGHSDADVACHAAIDAILGAASLGDIGTHFPDTDPRWKDASSLNLLTRVAKLVGEHGLEVGNIDLTVVLEKPKLRSHIAAMRAAVAGAIGVDVSRVSIKAKTNEGVDAIGRGEAIAAHAVALIRHG